MLVYEFAKEKVNGQIVHRPKVPIWLKHKGERMRFFALLDSGADTTVIPEPVAKFLKLKYDPAQKDYVEAFQGVRLAVARTRVDVVFLASEPDNEVLLSNVPAFVALGGSASRFDVDIVLGTESIFDHFDITFKKRRNKIILEQ